MAVQRKPSRMNKGTCPMDCACSEYAYRDYSLSGPISDVCYANGTRKDHSNASGLRDLGEAVWGKVAPPPHFPRQLQPVSARKIDIVRAQLMEKSRTPATTKHSMKTIGYYSESGKTKSGVSIQSFMSNATRR